MTEEIKRLQREEEKYCLYCARDNSIAHCTTQDDSESIPSPLEAENGLCVNFQLQTKSACFYNHSCKKNDCATCFDFNRCTIEDVAYLCDELADTVKMFRYLKNKLALYYSKIF